MACWRSASICLCAESVMLALGLLSLGHAALDGRGAVGIRLLEAGHHELPHHHEKDGYGDEAEDQLPGVGQDGELVGLTGTGQCHGCCAGE